MRDANTQLITACCRRTCMKKYLNRPAWQKWWFSLVALRGQRVKLHVSGFPRVFTCYSRMLLTSCSSDVQRSFFHHGRAAPHWYRRLHPNIWHQPTDSSPRPLHLYVADVTCFQSSSFQSETVSLVSMEAWWWNILLFPVFYGMFA